MRAGAEKVGQRWCEKQDRRAEKKTTQKRDLLRSGNGLRPVFANPYEDK